jgi:hypothetical protein
MSFPQRLENKVGRDWIYFRLENKVGRDWIYFHNPVDGHNEEVVAVGILSIKCGGERSLYLLEINWNRGT